MLLAVGPLLAAGFAITDPLKPEAVGVVAALRALGLQVLLSFATRLQHVLALCIEVCALSRSACHVVHLRVQALWLYSADSAYRSSPASARLP